MRRKAFISTLREVPAESVDVAQETQRSLKLFANIQESKKDSVGHTCLSPHHWWAGPQCDRDQTLELPGSSNRWPNPHTRGLCGTPSWKRRRSSRKLNIPSNLQADAHASFSVLQGHCSNCTYTHTKKHSSSLYYNTTSICMGELHIKHWKPKSKVNIRWTWLLNDNQTMPSSHCFICTAHCLRALSQHQVTYALHRQRVTSSYKLATVKQNKTKKIHRRITWRRGQSRYNVVNSL